MSYASFKTKWLGKRVDYDGVYQYQCVDLIKQWAKEEYGISAGAWGNAIDYATRPSASFTKHFNRVANPQQGDIVVFSGQTYGHIGLIDGVTAASINTLEQNGSTGGGSGTGGDAIRTRYIPKTRVAAYYRHKSVKQGGEMADRNQVNNIYQAVLHRDGDEGGLTNYTGRDANSIVAEMLNSQEFKNHQNFLNSATAQIQALQVAVKNAENKPPQTVYREVEKIVEKIVKVEVPVEVEVTKEVEKPLSWKRVIDWIISQFKKDKE